MSLGTEERHDAQLAMERSRPTLVTVVMPTFNGAKRIHRAIQSVLSQDYTELELIVVDDASTDDTASVVSAEAEADPRIRLLCLDINSGPFVARCAALEASHGALVAFIDDDDEWLPGKLRRQVDLLERRPDVALVHSSVIDIFPDGARRNRLVHRRANAYRENLCQDRIATSTVVARRSAIDEAGGFDSNLRAFGDWDLWIRILKGHKAESIEQPLAEVNLRQGSIQRGSVDVFENARRVVMEKHRQEAEAEHLIGQSEARFHYAVAAKLQQSGQSAKARSRALTSFRCAPNLEALSLIGLTLLPSGLAHRARLELRRVRTLIRL